MQFQLSGLASGFDWQSMVDQLTELERAPQRRMRSDQAEISQKQSTLNSLTSELNSLKTKLEALSTGDIFDQRSLTNSDDTVATASTSASGLVGTYNLQVTQLATTSSWQGNDDVGSALHSGNDVSAVTLSAAAFRTAITAGTITVNNQQITIATSDSLGDVLDAIKDAIGGSATASYDATNDKITIDGDGSVVVLGSAKDTSNFLQIAELKNNGTDTVTSTNKLGRLQTSAVLSSGNFETAFSTSSGSFKINGVSVTYDSSTDTLNDIIDRINNASAGVLASYDAINDRLQLTNDTTGDLGMSLSDVSGNFLAASGLLSGSLTRGNNMEFSINSGGTISSNGNTVNESITGIEGLQITALKTGSTTLTVDNDRTAISESINGLITQYNKVQTFLSTHTGTQLSADGSASSGILSTETDIRGIVGALRSNVTATVSTLAAGLNELGDLGVSTSGYSNSLTLSDSSALDDAILNNLAQVKQLFQDSNEGLAVKLLSYVDTLVDDEGAIADKISNLSSRSDDIDDQIERQERLVQARRQSMVDSFVAMESAQQQVNQQMQFLQSKFL
jgi:flagellar hook-associated protein 2